MSRFWRIPLSKRRTNPYPVKKFWVYPNPTMYFVKIPNPVNTLSDIVSFAAVIRVVRHWSWHSDQIPRGTQQIFIREGSAPRSNPLPIYIPFFTKKIPLRIPSIDKRCPFHIPLFRTLHPFQLLWMHCLLNRNQSQKLNEGGVRGVRIPQYRTWKRENTAIPHQNLAKYRNRSYKWEKVDVVNTTNPPFK